MLRIGGYATLTDRESGKVTAERDTFSCGHCNRITHVRPKARAEDCGGLCKVCMSLICERCVGFACVTLEARLEREEASYHARRSYGI